MVFAQNLRFASRMLARTPALTAVAVLCLAVGIGVNSTVYSFVDGLWLRPLPVRHPAGLVHLFLASDRDAFGELSYPEYETFRQRTRTFAGLLVTQRRGPILSGDGFAEATMSNVVSDNYFSVLGLRPQLGRLFAEGDRASGPVVVMSYNLWQRRFGGDPGIVGRTVRLGKVYTVVGIAPRGFRGLEPWIDSDFWIPMSSWDAGGGERFDRSMHDFMAIGRLRPGVSVGRARAEVEGIARDLGRAYPRFDRDRRGMLYSARAYQLRDGGAMAGLLIAMVIVVLLIACANVANLLLARAGARARELAVRAALGGGRLQLLGQLLTESALLALLGTAAGLLLAAWLIPLLPALVTPPGDTTTHFVFRLDARVLGVTLAASLLTLLAFGLLPAWRMSRPEVAAALRGGRHGRAPRGRIQPRGLLVIAQLALSLMLLAGAGLLVRSFVSSLHANLGFQRRQVLVAEVVPPDGPARAREFYRALLQRVRVLPGVRRATLAMRPPLWNSGGGAAQRLELPGGRPFPGDGGQPVKFNIVGPEYFGTLGIPLLRGRAFDDHDRPDGPPVMIISRTMARRFWPGRDPIGTFVHASQDPDSVRRQIVGVVGDARINSVQEAPEPYFYVPYAQSGREMIMLLVETDGLAPDFGRQLRAAVAQLDRQSAVLKLSSLGLVLRASVYEQQVGATLVGALGGIALLLAAIGLYGVVAYLVSRRTREIGIRLALGAQRQDALALVMWHGVRLALPGIALGLAGALALARLLANALYGVSPWDPVTFAGVSLLMAGVALAASYVPARRAAGIDPMTAIRSE